MVFSKRIDDIVYRYFKVAQLLQPTQSTQPTGSTPDHTTPMVNGKPEQNVTNPSAIKPATPINAKKKDMVTMENGKEYHDRFQGAQGEELQKLINEEAKSKGFMLVPEQKTPLNETMVILGFINAISKMFPDLDKNVVKEFALIIAAQAKLETGLRSCHNWNTGNIHATKGGQNNFWKGKVSAWDDPQMRPDGSYFTHKWRLWRAYDNVEEGLGDHLLFLIKRFPKAVEFAKAGDAVGFTKALRESGYFTAPLSQYTKGMVGIRDGFKKKLEKASV